MKMNKKMVQPSEATMTLDEQAMMKNAKSNKKYKGKRGLVKTPSIIGGSKWDKNLKMEKKPMMPLEQSVDKGVQKGLKNFRVR